MHPYFSTFAQPWQTFNPIDVDMTQRPSPWFDPTGYQALYNQVPYNQTPYRVPFPGLEATPYYANNPYFASIVPRSCFPARTHFTRDGTRSVSNRFSRSWDVQLPFA
jgi:hypothetical protein